MFEVWIEMERFYTFALPLLALIFLFLLLVYIFVYSYTQKGQLFRKWATGIFLTFLIASASYLVSGHIGNSHWLEQNNYITPGIRSHTYILGMQSDEDPELVRYFGQSGTLSERLSALDMYQAEEVSEPFPYTYIGTRDRTHYFAFGENERFAFRIRGEVTWHAPESVIRGRRYQLTDERFTSIGFVQSDRITFESLSLAEAEQEPDDLSAYQMVEVQNVYGSWIFSDQRN